MSAHHENLPDPDSEKFRCILEKDLVMNVFKSGKWGSMRHVPLPKGNQLIVSRQRRIVILFSKIGEIISFLVFTV